MKDYRIFERGINLGGSNFPPEDYEVIRTVDWLIRFVGTKAECEEWIKEKSAKDRIERIGPN